MTWCNDCNNVETIERSSSPPPPPQLPPQPPPPSSNTSSNSCVVIARRHKESLMRCCPSCGHQIKSHDQARIHDLPGLPAGVKFDPTDQELLEHLEGKVKSDIREVHPLIDEFIPTIDGENGICYTHPEKLPGVSKDGVVRHFFHRPSKAYTTGTRKRRKVHTDNEGGETRWHKTGKTRPVLIAGKPKGYKKILVLYTNYGKERKPEKTNWVMHQYHLGNNEEEKDGELVVSKVFYQTQPRQCGSAIKDSLPLKLKAQIGHHHHHHHEGSNHNNNPKNATYVEYYNNPPPFITFDQSGGSNNGGQSRGNPSSHHLLNPHFSVQDGSSFMP